MGMLTKLLKGGLYGEMSRGAASLDLDSWSPCHVLQGSVMPAQKPAPGLGFRGF